MSSSPFPKAILFDLDGTCIDTSQDLLNALNHTLIHYTLESRTRSELKHLIGLGAKVMLEKSGVRRADLARALEIFSAFYEKNIDKHSCLYGGFDSLFSYLADHDILWGVVTNKTYKFARLLLDKLSLNPQILVGGDTLIHRKPDPDQIHYALRFLHLKAQDCLFVGDSIYDITAAHRAGMKVVAVQYGFSPLSELVEADYQIEHIMDLINLDCFTHA